MGKNTILGFLTGHDVSYCLLENGIPVIHEELERFLNVKNVVTVNSGTAAILASFMAFGVGPGDEVFLQSYSFQAAANMVMLLGAKPIFEDIELDNYGISVDDLKKKITSKTKLIIITHLYGYPSKIKEINEIANQKSILINLVNGLEKLFAGNRCH